MEKQEMLGQYFFSEDLEIEEKQLLVQKTEYYRDRESLPREIIKPVELLYDEENNCIGYSFEEPDFPCLSLKQLFQKEKTEQYHIDGHLLFSIAKKVLYILMDLAAEGIYPGLIDLSSILVHEKRPDKAVAICHVEHFQAGELPSTYSWYPSDIRLFGEEIDVFDEITQKKADAKLIYKILTVCGKGNAKIPPNPRNQELSYVFWNILSREWKDFFLNLDSEEVKYEHMMELLSESIEEEKYYTDPDDRKMTEEVVLPKRSQSPLQKAYATIIVLREAGKSAHDISRQLYLLQENLEEDKYYEYEQAFVLGDKHPFAREFASYPEGFRSQLAHQIHSYSFGEALLIGCEMTAQVLEQKKQPAFLFVLVDGEILNDAIYQYSLKKLEELKEEQDVKVFVLPAREHRGEGYGKLLEVGEERRL